MGDDVSVIEPSWIAALTGSIAAFRGLVLEPATVDAWAEPSALEGYTVGGIAGHVLSLLASFRDRLTAEPSQLATVPYVDWYGQALTTPEHPGLVRLGEQLASTGAHQTAAMLGAVSDDLDRLLTGTPCGKAIPLTSVPGAAVRLDDFLRTRILEIVVHSGDIASGIGCEPPSFQPLANQIVSSVMTETLDSRNGKAVR